MFSCNCCYSSNMQGNLGKHVYSSLDPDSPFRKAVCFCLFNLKASISMCMFIYFTRWCCPILFSVHICRLLFSQLVSNQSFVYWNTTCYKKFVKLIWIQIKLREGFITCKHTEKYLLKYHWTSNQIFMDLIFLKGKLEVRKDILFYWMLSIDWML